MSGGRPLQLIDGSYVRAAYHRGVHLRVGVRVDHSLIGRVEVVGLVLPLIEELDASRTIARLGRLLRMVHDIRIESLMLLVLLNPLLGIAARAALDLLSQEEVVVHVGAMVLIEVRIDQELTSLSEIHFLPFAAGLRPSRIIQIQRFVGLFLSAWRPLPLLELHVQGLSADRVVIAAGHRRQVVLLDLVVDTVESDRLVVLVDLVELTILAAAHKIIRAKFDLLISWAHFRVES